MKTILEMISEHLSRAFEEAGYDGKYGRASLSNRPDLCEYQCNGAMAAAKEYKKAPIMIAQDVAAAL
ncbi:MAG: arginine--tRNA ligase, partial [Lachnospiraceae bacterium]|nr:arginine--tRNA ligase [Lachnospiraceae bacterium]